MKKPLSLYKGEDFKNLREALAASAAAYPGNPAFLEKTGEEFRPVSYADFLRRVNALGTALKKRIPAGTHCILMGENSVEWAEAFMTVINGVGIVCPIDCETESAELGRLVNVSDSGVILYSEKSAKAVQAAEGVTKICFSEFESLEKEGEKMLSEGDVSYIAAEIDRNVPACIFFTSGTTGASRGVMLSQGNICFDIAETGRVLKHNTDDVFMAVLPLHHAYSCSFSLLFPLCFGACVAIGRGLRYLTRDIQEARPTIICCVPMMLDTIYRKILAGIRRKGESAERISARLAAMSGNNIALKKRIFGEIHRQFGGRLRLIITGGAAADPAVIKGMRSYGFFTIQGYGLTECAPLAAVNRDDEYRDSSVGLPTPHAVFDIFDIRKDGTGEIRYKGGNVMLGYYKDPDATAEVIRNGWFYTGDIGYIDAAGYLYITGRKKNVIVTNGGKNIFPEELEVQLGRDRFIEDAVVVAYMNEGRGDYDIVAVLHPDDAAFREAYGRDYLRGQVEAEFRRAVEAVNSENVHYKHIRYFVTRTEPFEKNASRKTIRAGVAGDARNEYLRKLAGGSIETEA